MLRLLAQTNSKLYEASLGEVIEMTGSFVRYIYRNEEFIIASFMEDNFEDFVARGNIPFELVQEREYRIVGIVEDSLNRKTNETTRQLKITSLAPLPPKGKYGIIRYLQTLKGLNALAADIYDVFGEKTMEALKTNPELVAKSVRGISLKKSLDLQRQVLEADDSSEALVFLLGIGLSLNEAVPLINRYREGIIEAVQTNPFLLTENCGEFQKMSFRTVDKIAKSLKSNLHSKERLEAGIMYAFELEANFGNVYTDMMNLINRSKGILSDTRTGLTFDNDAIGDAVEDLIAAKKIKLEGTRLYDAYLYQSEVGLATEIVRLTEETDWKAQVDHVELLENYCRQKGYDLEPEQKEAILACIEKKGDTAILTGPAGSGKTFTVNIVLDLLYRLYQADYALDRDLGVLQYLLVAPTGKAAKVLGASTGRPTSTIHSALGLSFTKTGSTRCFNSGNPFEQNVFVVDESSMLDTPLANELLNAIKSGSKVIFLGDVHQLPSIGAGNVLHDLIESGVPKCVSLRVSKRQGKGSTIFTNALKILDAEAIQPDNKETFYYQSVNGQQSAERVVRIFSDFMSKGGAIEDLQVLLPMKKGNAGTHYLNYRMQEMVRANKEDLSVLNHRFSTNNIPYELRFYEGDKVIQTQNNSALRLVEKLGTYHYQEKEENYLIANGETGVIDAIYETDVVNNQGRKQKQVLIVVRYDDKYVQYRGNDKQNLDHAYAISIHKSQGSQWLNVIQVLSMEHSSMLDNSLFYTGYTRGQEKQILIAEPEAVQLAMQTHKASKRRTTLGLRLEKEMRKVGR